jgi:2-phosphoglycerate kinase
MEADELFNHALTSLPEAVGDLLRAGRDTRSFIFASFDGASELGMALIASDLAGDLGIEGDAAKSEVAEMIRAANRRGEELVVSLMVTKDVLTRVLTASNVDAATRIGVALWLEREVTVGHFRVVAIAGDQVRAATVDGVSDLDDDAPVSSSLLN